MTNSFDVPFETDKINRLFGIGLSLLHIRKPKYNSHQLSEFINNIESRYHNRIVIHSHYQLVKKFGLKGIHISRQERKSFFFMNMYLPWIKRSNQELSLSSTIEHIESVKDCQDKSMNYILMNGIFNLHTESKLSFKYEKLNLKGLLNKVDIPIYAMGHISQSTIEIAENLGFYGSVLQSYIWDSPDFVQTFQSVFDKTEDKKLTRIRKA